MTNSDQKKPLTMLQCLQEMEALNNKLMQRLNFVREHAASDYPRTLYELTECSKKFKEEVELMICDAEYEELKKATEE
jgi:hypothetical protein